ncbi:uncharacterized protein L969DRAFT_50197, partial [Mixia osmundae IAM 14324]
DHERAQIYQVNSIEDVPGTNLAGKSKLGGDVSLNNAGGNFGKSETLNKLVKNVFGKDLDKDLHGDRAVVAEAAGLSVDDPALNQPGRLLAEKTERDA